MGKERKSDGFLLKPGDRVTVWNSGSAMTVRFRVDPVPQKYGHHPCPCRRYRSRNELRAYADRDMAALARAGRKRDLEMLFEVYRSHQRCWKKQSKRRHQW